MKRVPLYANGLKTVDYALVDDVDYDRLMLWRWSRTRDGYAKRTYKTKSGKTIDMMMHRQILGLGTGEQFYGDHANRNKLDNRRANLRICTPQESAQHRGVRVLSRSRFRGVNYVAVTGRWIARVRVGGKLHNLGTYAEEEEAARVAAAFRRQNMPFSIEDLA